MSDLPSDVLASVLASLDTRALACVAATCRRLLASCELAGSLRTTAAGWPLPQSFTTSAVRAARLVESVHVLPNGLTTHVRDHRSVPLAVVGADAPHVPLPALWTRARPEALACTACCLLGNVWVNGTDGALLCGRRQYDGSGGNGCALMHAAATRHLLVFKLGTVQADLRTGLVFGDAFSYAVHEEVLDPQLPLRLARLGIDPSRPASLAASMADMAAESNTRKHAAIGRWLRIPPDAVPDRLAAMNFARREEVLDTYFHASRASYHAQRAAVAPAEPLVPPVLAATMQAQRAALAQPPLAALLAAETAVLDQLYQIEQLL